MQKCSIKLTPLDWYFFGGENTFGEGENASYFAKSNLLPQQSALLGMLRFQLLKENDLLPLTEKNKEKAIDIIGNKSFDFKDKEKPFAFGAIKKISPIFLSKEKEILFYPPANRSYSLDSESCLNVFFGEKEGMLPLPCTFEQKEYFKEPDYWLDLKGESYKTDDIFVPNTRIGITKHTNAQQYKNEDGFYKIQTFKLNKGYSFLFFVDLDANQGLPSQSLVYLGAERTLFSMEVEETDFNPETDIPCQLEKNQLFFLSDAFVSEEVLQYCYFAWIETIPFRNIIRKTQHQNYATLDRGKERSIRYNLIKRGGILYFKNENKEKILQFINHPYLQNTGYNLYKI